MIESFAARIAKNAPPLHHSKDSQGACLVFKINLPWVQVMKQVLFVPLLSHYNVIEITETKMMLL